MTSSLAPAFKEKVSGTTPTTPLHQTGFWPPPTHRLSFVLVDTFQHAQAGIFGVCQGPSSEVHQRHYGQDFDSPADAIRFPLGFRRFLQTNFLLSSFRIDAQRLLGPDRYVPTDRKHPRGTEDSHLVTVLSFATNHFSLTTCAKGRRRLFKFAVLAGDCLNSTNVGHGPHWGWPKNRNIPVDHRGSITWFHGFRDSQCILRSNEVVCSSLSTHTTKLSIV